MIISIEGADGTGKSSICKMLSRRLSQNGLDVVCLHEPGSTDLGNILRDILLNNHKLDISPLSELFLFCSARAQLIAELLAPAIKDKKIVLIDRYIDSTIVYQGMVMGIGEERVIDLMELFFGEFFPDITIVLDSTLENVLSRIANKDKIEARGAEFQNKVLSGFRRICDIFPDRAVLIDSNRTLDEVIDEVWQVVSARL